MERHRRGKAHRARTGTVNLLSGAPFGYRYAGKTGLAITAGQPGVRVSSQKVSE